MYNWAMEERRPLPLEPKTGGMAFTVIVILNLLVNLIASGITLVGGFAGTDAEKYVSYLASPVAIAILLVIALKYAKQPARVLMPVRTRPKYILIGVMLVFGLLFSLNSANGYLVKLFELMGYTKRGNTLPDISGWKIVPAILVIAVVPAVMEEILFRGILLGNVKDGLGYVRSVFIVGFCFCLYHASVEQTIYQFICGCLFALLAIRSQSITPTVIIHFLNNAVIIVLCACGLVDPVTGELMFPQTAFIVVTVLSALCLVGAVVWLILDKQLNKKCRKGEVKNFFIYASVGIAALALMWIAGTIMRMV